MRARRKVFGIASIMVFGVVFGIALIMVFGIVLGIVGDPKEAVLSF